MDMDRTKNRKLLVGGAAAAFVLGAGAVAGAAVGAGPFETNDSGLDSPSEMSEATQATTPNSLPEDGFPSGGVDGARTESTTFVDIPVGGTQTLAAGAAGFVTVTRDASGVLRVVAVAPAAGWVFEIEPGDEIGEAEVDFRNGVSRVQFNAELEDGAVRVRVRTRGVAAVPTTGGTLPDGTLPRTDNSGPGSLNSGPGSVDEDGNSGPGSGTTAPTTPGTLDDNGGGSNSGPGGGGDDDSGSDDDGGESGSGSSGSGGSGPG
jgi:hypothetical protein